MSRLEEIKNRAKPINDVDGDFADIIQLNVDDYAYLYEMTKMAEKSKKEKEIKEVWIVMYSEYEVGSGSILDVFTEESKAKDYIADYVLNNDINTAYLYLERKEIVM